MRLLSYLTDDGPRVGALRGEAVVPVPGHDMLGLIEAGADGLARAGAADGAPLPLSSLRLLAPIPTPRRNVFCVGLNYLAHAQEGADARGVPLKLPERPLFFTKATLAVIGPQDDIPFDDNVSVQIDWEVELGVIIGTAGKNIAEADALRHVWGYTVINDVSWRDIQRRHGNQWHKGKSLDGTCPMGPWIVTADAFDPADVRVTCRVNGVDKQDSRTRYMYFKIPRLIAELSAGMTLEPGDVISTGTPAGVGYARTPAEFLKPGDLLETEVEGIGVLRNTIG